MYINYRLQEKDPNGATPPMFASSRPPNINLGPPTNFAVPPQYHPHHHHHPDYPPGYHTAPGDHHGLQSTSWPHPYVAQPRDDWHGFALAPPGTIPTSLHSGQVFYSPSADFGPVQTAGGSVMPSLGPGGPGGGGGGKTRTKDKYRVVYSDYQRLELEKEFQANRFITIRRKSELASHLGLSERQA
ncbi:homeobox protein CDX-1-like [Lampetra fluviatilis]